MRFDELKHQGAEWLARARHVVYLNEIALDKEELEAFLGDLKEWRNLLSDSEESRFALAVAAVNWACYQEEDEGFRDSFCRQILGMFDDKSWRERLGAPIEDAIIFWRWRPVREGPYRYVGLIREQAGLSYHHLERFAQLLNTLKTEPGWYAVQSTPNALLQDSIRRRFGQTSSGSYLCSPSGLTFIQAVCRDLASYYYRRLLTLDDLDSARGYRPGVMRIVVGFLEHQLGNLTPSSRGHAWAEPRLVLEDDGRLYVQFDPGEVSRRLIRCNQYSLPLYDPKLPVGTSLLPRDVYSGTRNTSSGEESWSARGWRSIGKDWALFDAARQFVCSSREPVRIPPGSYFLVIDATLPIDQNAVTASYGYLDLDGTGPDVLYSICAVDLTSERALSGLEIQSVASVARPKFEGLGETETWARYAGIDAIWSRPNPMLRLHHWTEENSRRFVVVRRIGEEEPIRIPIQPTADGIATIDLSDVPVPSIGRVWLEPKGRTSSAGYAPCQFTFARWPHCHVPPPHGLWAADATPKLRFILDASVRCDVDPTVAVPSTVENEYQVYKHVTVISACLTCGGISLRVRLPVHRARLMAAEAPDSPLFLEPASFTLPSGNTTPFLLTALPGSLVDLVLADCGIVSGGVVVAHKQIGASGFCMLQPNEMVDAIQASAIGIGRFEIHCADQKAATDAWYVNVERLRDQDVDIKVLASLPEPIALSFRIMLAVKDGIAIDMSKLHSVVPSNATRLAALWAWAAKLLDGWVVPARAIECLEDAHRQVLVGLADLIKREASLEGAKDAVREAKSLIEVWDKFRPEEQLQTLGLKVERWSSSIKQKRTRIAWIADVEHRTTEAVAAVQTKAPGIDVPDLLKNAWRLYLLAESFEPKSAKLFLADASDHIHVGQETMPPPWCDISQLLVPMCYLRLCLIRSFLAEMRRREPPRYANLAWRELKSIAGNLIGKCGSEQSATDSFGIGALSPRRDDKSLGRALAGGLPQWIEAGSSCWLGAWLGWRWSHFTNQRADEKERMYDLLRNRAVLIPQSLDREDLMMELESMAPGVWQ